MCCPQCGLYRMHGALDMRGFCLRRGGAIEDEGERGGKRRKLYKEHLELLHPQVQAGMKQEPPRYFQGSLRMDSYKPTEGWITHPDGEVRAEVHCQAPVHPAQTSLRPLLARFCVFAPRTGCRKLHRCVCVQNVFIKGFANLNRAFDGDTVIVEILPESKWEAPSFRLPGKGPEKGKQAESAPDNDGASIVPVHPPCTPTPCSLFLVAVLACFKTSIPSLNCSGRTRCPASVNGRLPRVLTVGNRVEI